MNVFEGFFAARKANREAEEKLREGKNVGHDLKIRLESLNFHQALLWLLIHERRRHLKDIAKIDADIARLQARGVRLQGFTEDELDTWVDA